MTAMLRGRVDSSVRVELRGGELEIEWEGRADKEDPEKKQARGKDAIAGLRSLLG